MLSLVLVSIRVALSPGDEAAKRAQASMVPPPRAPGAPLFPKHRIVGFYGAPQDKELGELGIGTPQQVAVKLKNQAEEYASPQRPVIPAFELLGVIASSHPGDDGMYRTRQNAVTIQRYLDAAREAGIMLILDIQPGHADFLTEAKILEPYLIQPDVGLALDAEWHLPEGQIPGQTIGSVSATEVNDVAEYMSGLVTAHHLPQKLLLLHTFTDSMITPKFALRVPTNLAEVINVDGVGGRKIKQLKYTQLTARQSPNLWRGFKLFFHEDDHLMSPIAVLRLQPPPDVVVYE
jgi:hypothetical protein